MKIEGQYVSLTAKAASLELNISREAVRFLKEERSGSSFSVIPLRLGSTSVEMEEVRDPEEEIVKRLLELITGREVRSLSLKEITDTKLPQVEEPKFGAQYSREEISAKVNELRFYAYGEVRTGDGRRIEFQVELNLFNLGLRVEKEIARFGSLAFVDPLIINLDGSPDLLSSSEFEFDLEGDGNKERIPYLAKGKGFIFFDRNGNGSVDGGEIVGVRTGDAFAELRDLDEDGNEWIDEGDGAFEKLKVWIKNAQEDRVLTLSQVGVGALYTGDVEEFFNLGNRAIVRNLGIFLTERGTAGVLTKLDFVV